ncbi:pilus assembly protein TadG-related protein [Acidisphaera sp. L21]|uniref:pilus assembly protein TadG-related protein n=1 Tax=Acidisphaera sp. L21 TaxID=1641851 RepID=UPI00131BE638|nr:pilus assembly protein TadG-related protein [Acidisphaera sp. L21]
MRWPRWGACVPRRDRRGNVAIVTALIAVPLIGFAALAVDVGAATSAHATLDAAADSAALLATTVASNQYQAGSSTAVATATAAAKSRFVAQAGTISSVVFGTPVITVTQTGTQFTSNVTYSAVYTTALGAVVGMKTIPLSGVSSASMSVNPYVDIQVLMDTSASMLIAATASDISNLQALTTAFKAAKNEVVPDNAGQQCAFACHWNTAGTDYLALAQLGGVTLRLDVLRSAVGNLITNIAAANKYGTFRLGLSTFAQAFSTIYSMSSSISGASTALASISPDVNMCTSNCPETYFSAAMSSLAATTTASGDGSTQAKSQKYLFIVSDGLVDQMSGSARVIGPISPTDCQALKNNGVIILTLYTPYLPLPTNPFYMSNVWQYQSMGTPDQIQQAMTACASATNYAFVASNSADIDTQLNAMLATVLQTSGHFTQ